MLTIAGSIEPFGLIVPLRLSVSLPKEVALRTRRREVPIPLDVQALIDTGADCSLIDPSLILELKLFPTGRCVLRSLDTALREESLPTFDVDVAFVGEHEVSGRFTMRLAAKTLADLPYKMLLGRDLLRFFRMQYDGPESEFRLIV